MLAMWLYPPTLHKFLPSTLRGQKRQSMALRSVSDQTPYQTVLKCSWQMAADIGGSNRACIFSGYDSTPKKALIGLGGGAAKILTFK